MVGVAAAGPLTGVALTCRCEEEIEAGKDEVSRLLAMQTIADKALDVGAAQVAELKQSLEEKASSLISSDTARGLLKASKQFLTPRCSLCISRKEWRPSC